MIQPLGEQIIIRAIPTDSIGSIIVPDSAKSITQKGEDGSLMNYVEAEVIAVGPGKRQKGDLTLIDDLVDALDRIANHDDGPTAGVRSLGVQALIHRARNSERVPLTVRAGDRILYHPAVQRFDRKVEGLGDGDFYVIREESVLAILEP